MKPLTKTKQKIPQSLDKYQAWVIANSKGCRSSFEVTKKVWSTAPDHIKNGGGLPQVIQNICRALSIPFRQGEILENIRGLRYKKSRKKPDMINKRGEREKALELAQRRAPLFDKIIWTRVDARTRIGKLS